MAVNDRASSTETVEETNVPEKVDESRNSKEKNVEETESNSNDISESTDHFDQNDKTIVDTAEEASGAMMICDEVCNDKEYEKAMVCNEVKSICSVDPLKYSLDGLESFRENIEDYFKRRKDAIEKVIKCEVVNFGNK